MRVIDVFAVFVSGFSYFWYNYAPWLVFFVGIVVFAYIEIAARKGGASKDNSVLFTKKINAEEEKLIDKIDALPIKDDLCGVTRNYIEPGTFSQIAENYRRLRAEKEREKEANGETVESYPTWEERELELLEHLAKERGETKKYL